MKFTKLSIALAFAAIATVALAVEPVDPSAIARQDLMHAIGGKSKALGEIAAGKVAFDAAAAAAAKAALLEAVDKIPATFKEPGKADPGSEAKPEIWTKWDDFAADAAALSAAVNAIDTTSADTIKAGMGAVGGACKACHSEYRS